MPQSPIAYADKIFLEIYRRYKPILQEGIHYRIITHYLMIYGGIIKPKTLERALSAFETVGFIKRIIENDRFDGKFDGRYEITYYYDHSLPLLSSPCGCGNREKFRILRTGKTEHIVICESCGSRIIDATGANSDELVK